MVTGSLSRELQLRRCASPDLGTARGRHQDYGLVWSIHIPPDCRSFRCFVAEIVTDSEKLYSEVYVSSCSGGARQE